MKPHRGVMILIFGILGITGVCFPLGIAAWIMGNGDLKQIDAGAMDPQGRGLTNAGRIIGMISTILLIIGFVVVVLLFALGAFGALVSRH